MQCVMDVALHSGFIPTGYQFSKGILSAGVGLQLWKNCVGYLVCAPWSRQGTVMKFRLLAPDPHGEAEVEGRNIAHNFQIF